MKNVRYWDEIVFLDYLRRNPYKADEYAELKMALQKRFMHDRDAYTEAKGEFIRDCVKEARNRKIGHTSGFPCVYDGSRVEKSPLAVYI